MFKLANQIFSHLSPSRRWQLLIVFVLMLMGAVAEVFTMGAIVPFLSLLVNPEMAGRATWLTTSLDWVAATYGGTRLTAAAFLFAGLAFSAALLRLALSWFSFRFVFAVGADIGETIYRLILQQPYPYHLQRNSSQTISAVEKVTTLVLGVMVPLMQLCIAVVMVVAILGAMIWVNPVVALGAGVVFGGLYMGITFRAKRWLKQNSVISAENGILKIKMLQEGLGAIRDVIIDGSHPVYVSQFSAADRTQRMAQAANQVLSVAPKYIVESIGMVLIVMLALLLVQQPGGVAAAMPVLGALALGAQRMLPYMQNIYSGVALYRGNMASAIEVLELLSLPDVAPKDELNGQPAASVAMDTAPLIELKQVTFAYAPEGRNVLNAIDLIVQHGARIGFTGETGGGKSTLIDLILGLLPASSGQVLINGKPLGTETMRAWQRRVAHVPQNIFLADSSIAENIALGSHLAGIDLKRLACVMEAAQMTDFVSRLPAGINTRVGERGIQLSGGQRQRIGIARALYKQADVLVLDEATSALDSDTEKRVMQGIYELNPKIAMLMIAHRVNTLSQCTAVYEVCGGSLVKTVQTETD